MGIVSFSPSPVLSVLLAPVQAIAAWFVPARNTASLFAAPARPQQVPKQLTLPFALPFVLAGSTGRRAANSHSVGTKIGRNASKCPTASHLKVVREFDAAVSPACAGRMVISGRMADVCAELERMVLHERMHAGLLRLESCAEPSRANTATRFSPIQIDDGQATPQGGMKILAGTIST
jgi:hypothetical protein